LIKRLGVVGLGLEMINIICDDVGLVKVLGK